MKDEQQTDGVVGGGRLTIPPIGGAMTMAAFEKLMAQKQTDTVLAAVQKLRGVKDTRKLAGSEWQGWVASGWF